MIYQVQFLHELKIRGILETVMKHLSIEERRSLSDFFNKIAAAWFSAGVITPFFIKPIAITDIIYRLVVGFGLSLLSLQASLALVKKLN